MGENTAIEWADHTFNPWIGCTKVGPGCDHCYAEALATVRLGVEWGPGAKRRRTAPSTWNLPRRWDRQAAKLGRRYRVFCASLADWADNAVDPAVRFDLGQLIVETPNLDWLLLTKRIGNALPMLCEMFKRTLMPPNFMVGATIVNNEEWLRDFPKMAALYGAMCRPLFLSCEPLLAPIDLDAFGPAWRQVIGWVIAGGESGHGARPMNPAWARRIRDACEARVGAAAVPFMFKQWGDWVNEEQSPANAVFPGVGAHFFGSNDYWARLGKKAAGRLLDGVTHDGGPA